MPVELGAIVDLGPSLFFQDAAKTVPCVATGDRIWTWGNGGSAAADAVQPGGANRMLYRAAADGVNGLPCAYCPGDGASHEMILTLPTPVTANACTVIVAAVREGDGASVNQYGRLVSLFDSGESNEFSGTGSWVPVFLTTSGSFGAAAPAAVCFRGGSPVAALTVNPWTTLHVYCAVLNGSSGSLSVDNGTPVTGSTSAALVNGDKLYVGGSVLRGDSEHFGKIARVLVYAGVLTAPQQSDTVAAVTAQFGGGGTPGGLLMVNVGGRLWLGTP